MLGKLLFAEQIDVTADQHKEQLRVYRSVPTLRSGINSYNEKMSLDVSYFCSTPILSISVIFLDV